MAVRPPHQAKKPETRKTRQKTIPPPSPYKTPTKSTTCQAGTIPAWQVPQGLATASHATAPSIPCDGGVMGKFSAIYGKVFHNRPMQKQPGLHSNSGVGAQGWH
jgi:hypothetical protein